MYTFCTLSQLRDKCLLYHDGWCFMKACAHATRKLATLSENIPHGRYTVDVSAHLYPLVTIKSYAKKLDFVTNIPVK